MWIVIRTNEHLHSPGEELVVYLETCRGTNKKAQDSSHHIVGESVVTVTEGTAAKLPKLYNLKRTIQRQLVQQLAAPVEPANLEKLVLPAEYQQTTKEEQF